MGLISENSSYLDNIVILLLIIAVTVGIDYSCRYIFLGMFKRLARKTKNQLDDLIVDRKIINKMMHMIPAILIYILLPFAFSAEETPKILILLQKLCQIYIIAVSLRFINASLNLIHEIYNKKDSFKNKPLKASYRSCRLRFSLLEWYWLSVFLSINPRFLYWPDWVRLPLSWCWSLRIRS